MPRTPSSKCSSSRNSLLTTLASSCEAPLTNSTNTSWIYSTPTTTAASYKPHAKSSQTRGSCSILRSPMLWQKPTNKPPLRNRNSPCVNCVWSMPSRPCTSFHHLSPPYSITPTTPEQPLTPTSDKPNTKHPLPTWKQNVYVLNYTTYASKPASVKHGNRAENRATIKAFIKVASSHVP